MIPILIGALGSIPKDFLKRLENPSEYGIKVGKNTGETPEDLRRFSVNQTPVKNYQLMLE